MPSEPAELNDAEHPSEWRKAAGICERSPFLDFPAAAQQHRPLLAQTAGAARHTSNARRSRRKRNNIGLLLLLLVFIGVAGLGGLYVWDEIVSGNAPVARFSVNFRNDAGFLDRDWFLAHTGLANPGHAAPGVLEIEKKLNAVGQIRRVKNIRRHIDDGGVDVEIEERTPVFRIRYNASAAIGAPPATYVVDDTGVVYPGINYGPEVLNKLPWLVGAHPRVPAAAKARPAAANALPIVPGGAEMAALIALARRESPDFFRRWESISAAEFKDGNPAHAGAYIRVRLRPSANAARMADLRDIVFSAAPEKFEFEFAAYASMELRARVVAALRKANPSKTPLFDLCLFFEDKSGAETGQPAAKQARLIPVQGRHIAAR